MFYMRSINKYFCQEFGQKSLWILFLLVVIANAAYLHRVPGLLGDEGSEGQNVFEILTKEEITIVGERSYIGPLIDYARVPFVGALGYSILALRLPMLLVTAVSFWLAAIVFGRLFSKEAVPYILALLFLSPIYLLYQRLGWAITLIPFFALLTLFFLTDSAQTKKYSPLLAGLSAGIGLANHLIFLPSLVGIMTIWLITKLRTPRQLLMWWPLLIGFWAGFGTQFAVLKFFTEDQGEPSKIAELFWERLSQLPAVIPALFSGWLYVSSYLGLEASPTHIYVIATPLALCIILALLLPPRRLTSWLWLAGIIIQTLVLLLIIDRFTSRYFVAPVLALWVLAGVGLARISQLFFKRYPLVIKLIPAVAALVLILFTASVVLVPFLQSGGSLNKFNIGQRTESAAALVETRSLVQCLRGAGTAYSSDVHIYNRLLYLSHYYPDLVVVDSAKNAELIVSYQSDKKISPEKMVNCTTPHFLVQKK